MAEGYAGGDGAVGAEVRAEDDLKAYFSGGGRKIFHRDVVSSMPVVRWCREGRWDDDGMRLRNAYGEVIYRHPLVGK